MRVHVTLHGFSRKEQELELAVGARADDAPRALGVRPELVLVFRSGDAAGAPASSEPIWKPLPADAPLREGDRLRILRVVSGGSGDRADRAPDLPPARQSRAPLHRSARVIALVGLLLVGPALADHVYSHRFIVEGRLVGIDGTPLPGRLMTLTSSGEDFLEPCHDGQQPVTDGWGDFRFCYHHHDLGPSSTVIVRYENTTVTRPVDVAFRKLTVLLREPNETGIAPPAWNETYRINGRAWLPGPMRLEGVQVFGEAVAQLPVNLTVRGPDATPAVFHTTTDGYGDFDLIVETGTEADNLSLTLEAMGRGQPVQLDTFFHRAESRIYVSPAGHAEEPGGVSATTGGIDASPGNTTPRFSPLLGVAVALGLVATIVMARRKHGP